MHRRLATLASLFSIPLLVGLLAGACAPAPGSGPCRLDPLCGGGGIGAFCDRHADCVDGYCCDSDHCDGGMCSLPCDSDVDCPVNMLCEHDTCFYICDSDRDCAAGQECKHGNTVCEWD